MIGFAVGMVFMAIYGVAMDTLLACFIVDETNQKAKGAGKPLYAPEELADLMETDWEPWFSENLLFLRILKFILFVDKVSQYLLIHLK